MRKHWTKMAFAFGALVWAVILLRVAHFTAWNEWRNEQLLHAVQAGNLRNADFWLNMGADANTSITIDYRPFYLLREPPAVSVLRQAGIPSAPLLFVNVYPAMYVGPQKNRAPMVSLLLDHGAKADAVPEGSRTVFDGSFPKRTALCCLIDQFYMPEKGDEATVATVKALLEHGANADNPEFRNGDVALFTLIESENHALLRLLLRKGAKQIPDRFGATPLQRAAEINDVEAIRILLDCGAKVDEHDQNHRTALMYAVRGSHFIPTGYDSQDGAVKLLLAHSANPNACDTNNKTVLMYAALATAAVQELLLAHGANPNAQDKNGNTALHHALDSSLNHFYWNCKAETLAPFQKYGGSFYVRNKKGKTPAALLQYNQKEKKKWQNSVENLK